MNTRGRSSTRDVLLVLLLILNAIFAYFAFSGRSAIDDLAEAQRKPDIVVQFMRCHYQRFDLAAVSLLTKDPIVLQHIEESFPELKGKTSSELLVNLLDSTDVDSNNRCPLLPEDTSDLQQKEGK